MTLIFGLKIDIEYRKQKDDDGKEYIIGKKDDDDKLKMLLKTKIIPHILDNQKILLILDGFDEIIDNKIKNLVISEIRELTRSLNSVNFILTSRSADYKLLLENTTVYEISELNEIQIKEFSDKWFQDSDLSEKFLTELYAKTPYKDFYSRPLLLTQLALIYSRTDAIPDKPKQIYQRIVEIVLKEWNEQQGVKRKTKYSTFTVERKREFLSNMAFNLTIKHNRQVFSKNELSSMYKEINSKFKELPTDEVESVIEEIETHNGLIIKSGYDSFEFSHLTIQEYLVADYIVRTGNIRRFRHSDLLKIPNELAIAVALSSEPSIFLYDLLVDVLSKEGKEDIDQNFLIKFFSRIKLEKPDFEISAIECIALLSIYSRMLDKIIIHGSFLHESNMNKLERFINEMFENDIENALKGYYVRDNTKTGLRSYVVDNGPFFEKEEHIFIRFRRLNPDTQYNFPQYLDWAKKDLNKKNESN